MPELTSFGESLLRLATPPETPLETTDTLDVHVGGAEGNVAVAAQRLGIETTWVSKLPSTPLGKRVTSTYRSHGVSTAVQWDEGGRLGTYYLEPGSEPRGSNVVYDRGGASIRTATPDELPIDPIVNADALHVTGITPALSDTLASTTERLLSYARDNGTTTVFDVNYRSNLWDTKTAAETLGGLLPQVDVLFVALRDARQVLGYDQGPEAVARRVTDEYDLELAVVTQGEAGALAYDGEAVVEQSTIPTETVDAIGTGDAFVGGFLAAWLTNGTLETSLKWGVATAALKRTITGDLALVRPSQVERVLAEDPPKIDR
ncbi:PfkB family carbohydrate kinase [Haloarchaeobius amylolyticus]|uniref:PfkB family carbohydrate kinase n=1 Tax=Haloarchaeobius amylolyticus TaxID=1198296 RepID=A0ABD6BD01_9EURY